MKIGIIGAGIGGLSAGIALRLKGHAVTIYEQAPKLTQIGAGLQISPNGARVLRALGVMDPLAAMLFEPKAIEMRIGSSGKQVFSLPMRGYASDRWGDGYYHIHRADFVDVLADRFAALGGDVVLNSPVLGFAQTVQGVSVTGVDAGSFDLLIGADGLKSNVRKTLFGDTPARFTGQVAWRCTVPLADVAHNAPPETACIWVGDKRHAVTTRVHGGQTVNFVGIVEKNLAADEQWNLRGSRKIAQQDFAHFTPPIADILAKTDEINLWPLYDRAPLDHWHVGRVVLLGDAAHPMLPSMAQGAVQALEDAWVLAGCLEAGSLADGLDRYATARQERTAKIQRMSTSNAQLFHQNRGLKGAVLYRAISGVARFAPSILQARQDWVYGHDVTG